jgi:hypothetical protein
MASFSTVVFQPRFLRVEDAGRYVGCAGLLTRLVDAGWLKPVVSRKKMTIFSRQKLDECCDRLERGEFPDCPQS